MKKIILPLILLVSLSVFSQNNTENKKIKNYLESTIKYRSKLIVGSTQQNVLASDIIESELTFSTGDKNGYAILQQQYFIKTANTLTPFMFKNDLLASSKFIESIKSKKFKLNNNDNGVAFQSMLALIDNEQGLGFFKDNNTWYFIRSKFFDNIKAYEVTTDKKGQILAIIYHDELKKELPETLLKAGEVITTNDSKNTIISKKDSSYMHNFLLKNVNYKFEISPLSFYSVNKISTISINKCVLKVTEGDKDMSSTTNISFMLVSNNNEYIKQPSINGLLKMPLFLKSLQGKYKLKTKEDARLFQYVLDDLSPINRSDIELKTFYKEGNMWIFVREKSFDDLKGFILSIDEKYNVSHIEYTTISEESILRIKMKDPNFKVDYKFKLVKPATNKITVKQGEGLSVEISFDADMVNAKGCWIMTEFDGNNSGMYASSDMKTPFTDGIPSGALENEHHTVEYFLMPSGENDIKNALGVIKIEITVK